MESRLDGGAIEEYIGQVLCVPNVRNKVIDITTIKNIWKEKYVGDARKKIASPDVSGLPLCLDCYGYQYGLEGFEHYEEKGFSVIEI